MTALGQWLQNTFGIGSLFQGRLLSSLAVVVVLWAIRRLFLVVAYRRIDDAGVRYRTRKTSLYVVVTVGLLIVGRIWFEGLQSVATFLGLLTAGLAIALKDLVVNLAGWAFILWRRPFEVGDRIQIGKHGGDIIDLRIFQFTLLEIGNWVDAEQSTGRIVHVPNGLVLSEALANYTRGFDHIWNEIPVLITFESNWKKAKELLKEIADQQGREVVESAQRAVKASGERFLISYSTLTPTVYTSVAEHGVMLTLRYLCRPRQRRGSSEAIWEAVLDAFVVRDDIDFAYPTQRFYSNLREGKSGARAPEGATSLSQ